MRTTIARLIVDVLLVYAAIGATFAVPFVIAGVDRIDPAARRSGWGFRLVILPGSIALWPVLLPRWIRGRAPREERNAHRSAARTAR